MKQKYVIEKVDKNTQIVINEFVELASKEYSLLSEQAYKYTDISKALKAGSDKLIKAIRSPNFFPPITTAEKLVEGFGELLGDSAKSSVEIVIDDVRVMNELDVEVEDLDDDDTDMDDLDEILTDEDEEIPDEDDE